MSRIGGLLLWSLLASSAIFASDRAAIETVLAQQEEAWNAADMEAFLRAYRQSDEVSFSGTHGISRGLNAVREVYRKAGYPSPGMGKLRYSGLEFRYLGPDAALVLGRWHLDRAEEDIGGVFSLVFQRFPEGWRIIHDHTSDVHAPGAGK